MGQDQVSGGVRVPCQHATPFATGAACQQRMLTPPDTWSCPTLGLASVLMLRPISPELACFRNFEFRTSLGTSFLLCRFSMKPVLSNKVEIGNKSSLANR